MKKTKIICVVGATASGKTALGVEIAKAVGGEIISSDSMQIYRGMPIATAVPTESERQGIAHHLVECLDVSSQYSAADFAERARTLISQISQRGNVPVIVGGTGLFTDTLTKGIKFSGVAADYELRKKCEKLSNEELYSLLLKSDPTAASDIHPNNRKRVIRALELCRGGVTKTEQNRASLPDEPPYDTLFIGIAYRDRQNLYDRINRRVDLMISSGLEDEARRMRGSVSSTAAQAIGHKELYPYLDGEITLEEACENLKKETRHYAKRQITWFKRNGDIHWLFADELGFEKLCAMAEKMSKEFVLEDSDEKTQKR